MTRIICIGDCHFGPGPRNVDRYAALDQIIAAGLALDGLGAWVQLGDLFHAKSTIEDRNAVAERLQKMAAAAPVIVIRGNHDADGDLEIFSRLHTAWPISVVDRPAVLSVRLATHDMAAISCLPYPPKGGLIAAGTTAAETFDAGREALTAVCRGLAADLDVERQAGAWPLFVAHLNIGGAQSSAGQPIIGRELEADPAMLQMFGDAPKILGHIHLPQALHGAVYAGSITANDWAEMEAKRFLVVEYDADEPGGWRRVSYPLATPRAYHVEGALTRDGFSWRVTRESNGKPVPADAPAFFGGDDVRVKFTYLPAEKDVLDFDLVRAPFAGARTLKLVPVPILDQAIRAPAVIAATTVTEQVRAYCAEQGIAVTDGLLAKLDKLQAPEAEDAALNRALPLEVTL